MSTTLPLLPRNIDLDSICLIWLDANAYTSPENVTAQKDFRSIIHHFQAFEKAQDCEQYIREKSNYDRVFLVVSGRLGQEIVPCIHQFRQVLFIYVYCQDKARNEEWAKRFSKMRGVIVELDMLLNQIRSDYSKHLQCKIDVPFPINIYKSNLPLDKSINDEFSHSQLLIDYLLRMKSIPTDKSELINICSKSYSGNNNELSIIREFEEKYIANQALWWFTRDTFLTRLLHKILSINNLDLLFLLAFFIRDIQQLLQKNKCNSPIQVYHGQLISNDELSLLKNSIGDYISINRLFSGKYNRKQIISSFNELPLTDNVIRVLFEIDADPQIDSSKPFAIITPFTYHPEEQQVLFTLGTIFQLIDVHHDKINGLWIVKITLRNLKKLYDETNLLAIGYGLQEIGKFDYAEKCFIRLLKELSPNHEDFSKCYHSLGFLSFLMDEYNRSLYWYNELIKILKPNDSKLSDIYYSIGCMHQKLGEYAHALDFYNKALHIWRESITENESLQMADCLNNMGCIYELEKNYGKALAFHQEALSIRQKFQAEIGPSYNNIGNLYVWLEQYDLALENYRYSFEVKSQSLALQDPSLATTLTNLGFVYEKNGDFEEALKSYRKAAVLFQKNFSETHFYNIEIQEDIHRISSL